MKNMDGSADAMRPVPGDVFGSGRLEVNPEKALQHIANLDGEEAVRAVVKVERGGPRLFLNEKEIYPLFALSTHMYPTIENYRQAGLNIYLRRLPENEKTRKREDRINAH